MKIKQETKDKIQDTFWMTKIIVKVLFYEVVLALVVMGVLYATNFKITVSPLVQTISPISTEK
jgi:hypothetical protein